MSELPMVVPAAGCRDGSRSTRSGPRDGLQNESKVVPLEVKAEFVQRLVAAGLPVVEATSFVHPEWVPSWPTPTS
jgi:hydroxymethylglutaryl-CoA lyase